MDQDKRVDDLPPPGGADGTGARDLAEAAGEASAGGGAAVGADADGPPRGRGRWVMAAVAALGVALFAVPFVKGPGDPGGAPTAGAPAASTCSPEKGVANFDITLKDMNGQDVRLADYKGKVVLLNFWATWCGPCREEMPMLQKTHEKIAPQGGLVLGVDTQDASDAAKAFLAKTKATFPSLRDKDKSYGREFGVTGYPETFLIDRKGRIAAIQRFPVTQAWLDERLPKLLEEEA